MAAQKCKSTLIVALASVCTFCCAGEKWGSDVQFSGDLKNCFTVSSPAFFNGSIPLLEVDFDLKRSRTCKCQSRRGGLTVSEYLHQDMLFFGVISLSSSRTILVPLSADSKLLRKETRLLIGAKCAN